MSAGFVGSSSTQTLGTGAGTGGTSLTVTKTGCTAGNLLVLWFSLWRSTNTDPGAASASGWTTGPQQVESASSRVRTGWIFLPSAVSGSNSASFTWANSSDCTAFISEYSGLPAAFLDGQGGSSGSNSPFNTGNVSSARSSGGLVLGTIADDGANITYSISDGKNSRGGQNPSASVPALLASDLLSSVSATNSAAWTSSPTNVPGNAVFAVGVLFSAAVSGSTRRLTDLDLIQDGRARGGKIYTFAVQAQLSTAHRTLPAAPAGTTPVSGADDTATGTDGVTQIGLTGADTAAGADGVTQIALSGADTGAGADAVSSIGLSAADTAAGANGVTSIGLNASDSATGADGTGGVGLGANDTASGADSVSLIALSVADTATGTDGASAVDLGATPKSGSDTATAADDVTSIALTGTDTGTGADAASQIALSTADTGVGADAASQVGLSRGDTATGADQVALVGLAVADTAAAQDGSSVVVVGAPAQTTLQERQRGSRTAPTASGRRPSPRGGGPRPGSSGSGRLRGT